MPFVHSGSARLHYEVAGDGFAVLLIAPGGMQSANAAWHRMPWDPITALADDYRVIGMDQRNAGQSTAPISADDGWHTYLADQLAVLDHLDVARCHVIGMCIGGPYITGLLMAAPERFASAVMIQPIGLDDNQAAFYEMFDQWADGLNADQPVASAETFASFRSNMYDGEFMFNTSVAEAAAIETPTLVLMGDDLYHPESTSRVLAGAMPNATLIERWKTEETLGMAGETIAAFLAEHTPAGPPGLTSA